MSKGLPLLQRLEFASERNLTPVCTEGARSIGLAHCAEALMQGFGAYGLSRTPSNFDKKENLTPFCVILELNKQHVKRAQCRFRVLQNKV